MFGTSIPVCLGYDVKAEAGIIPFASNLTQMCYMKLAMECLVYIAQIAHVHGSTNVSQYITAYERNSFKYILVKLRVWRIMSLCFLRYVSGQIAV